MKILVISDAWHPQINGVVRTYEYIGAELSRRGHDFKVIGPADLPRNYSLPGYPEIKLTLAPYKHLKRMIADYKPDAVHIATEGPLGYAARKYCQRYDMAFTSCYHTHFPDYAAKRVPAFLAPLAKKLTFGWLRRFHAPAASVMVVSHTLEQALKEQGFKNHFTRLCRGIDFNLFHMAAPSIMHHLPRPIALCVTRVAVEKNIETFCSMEWQGSKVIVGDGPQLETLKEKFKDCVFTGKKTGHDLAAHYQSADVFVFPSLTDTFGMVMIEALGCGLPVAAFDVMGPKDIIRENFLGALSQHPTPDGLATAARQALGCGAKQRIHDYALRHYSWEDVANCFIQAFNNGK